MKKWNWKALLLLLVLSEGVGALAGWLTREDTQLYRATVLQPPLSPPGWVFPVVWCVLYALMAVGAARIWSAPHTRERTAALAAFFGQLAMNFLWPIVFFGLGWYAAALLWLIALIGAVLWMIAAFERVDRTAAWLQTPYLLWLVFALYLNFGVWFLNR